MTENSSFEQPIRKSVNKLRLFLAVGLPLLGLVFVIALLVGIFRSAVGSWAKVVCANNLKQIGLALQTYAQNNQGNFPRGIYDPASADKPVAFTHAADNAGQLFTGSNAPVNDVTVPFFMLIRSCDLQSGLLVCQGTHKEAWRLEGQALALFSNFPKRDYLSYSIQNPYLKTDDPKLRETWWQDQKTTEPVPVAADRNPGTPNLLALTPTSSASQLKKGNSPNHDGDGQNVLFSDGHAEWLNTPFVGSDNIYTYGTGNNQGIIGSSTGTGDIILLPTPDMK